MAKVDIQELNEALRYDASSGLLFWKSRPLSHFKTEASMRSWNSRWAGKPAFTSLNDNGYKSGRLFGRLMTAHRIAWALHFGFWPEQVDHINGDRSDNRVQNLRDVGFLENSRNQKKQRNNSTGIVGISWCKKRLSWMAYIGSNGKLKHLGRYKCIAEAISARREAEVRLGYHANHGRTI